MKKATERLFALVDKRDNRVVSFQGNLCIFTLPIHVREWAADKQWNYEEEGIEIREFEGTSNFKF